MPKYPFEKLSDPTYKQTYFLTFRSRRIEEQYQKEFSDNNKVFRLSILVFFSITIFLSLYNIIQQENLILFTLFGGSFLHEYKPINKIKSKLLTNIVILYMGIYYSALKLIELQWDQLYFQLFSVIFQYFFQYNLPINLFITFLALYSFPESSPLVLSLIPQIPFIYLLEKRSRDLFIMTDNLRKQKKTFYTMVENSPNSVFVIDIHHRIYFSNTQAKNLLKKTLRNFSEQNSVGLNIMTLFEEKFHEKINQSVFECTLSHLTVRLFQIPVISSRQEAPHKDIKEHYSPVNEHGKSPHNLSISNVSSGFGMKGESVRNIKKTQFFNISIQNTFWKGGRFFLMTMESLPEFDKILEIQDTFMSLITSSLIESLELMEKDYQKWNNFQAIKVIKESDLKDLASIVIECNSIKGLASCMRNLNKLVLERNEHYLIKFNIRNTMVQCIELISIKALEKKIDLLLKFEESFPEFVYGEYENLKQLIYCLLRIINISKLSPNKKPGKFTLFCKLNRYSDDGRFILTFIFEYDNSPLLEGFFQEVLEAYEPNKPFNYEYLLKHSHWSLDQLSIIPLMMILDVEILKETNEEKSIFSLEMAFNSSDQNTLGILDKSGSYSSPSNLFLNKKPLQLSFCRISSNINNVIWREKPKAALSISKQIPHKKKNPFNIDFMKTSMKAGLLSQLEKDKDTLPSLGFNFNLKANISENNEKVSGINSSKPSETNIQKPNYPPNNVSVSRGTPSFEYIKRETEEGISNLMSPNWKQDPNGVNLHKSAIKGISSPSNSKNGAFKIEVGTSKKKFKGKNELIVFSQISEREMENSSFIKEERNSNRIPERINENILMVKEKIKGYFDKITIEALGEIINSYCPDRISIDDRKETCKINNYSSNLQGILYKKQDITSPKSDIVVHKKTKKYNTGGSVCSKKKKFSIKSNIIKSLTKYQNVSIGEVSKNLRSSKSKQNKPSIVEIVERKVPKKMSFIYGDENLNNMACFSCYSVTQVRRWERKEEKLIFCDNI